MSLKVSNSEALSLSCPRRHMYAFHPDFHLEPKQLSKALQRGNIGHAALEAAFKVIMEGGTEGEAALAANSKLIEFMQLAFETEDANMRIVTTELLTLIPEYLSSDEFKEFISSVSILGVEYGVELVLPGGTILPGRLDLLVKWTKGSWKGETVVVDNKFVYNFWSEDDFRMNSQIPSYVAAIREVMPDAVVKRGVINQIRWRHNAQDKFKMTPLPVSRAEAAVIIENHELLAAQAIKQRNTPVEEIKRTTPRMLSKYTCDKCPFKDLCKADLLGRDIESIIKMDYRPNSYGYDGVDDEDE
jgi:hypothetical protein